MSLQILCLSILCLTTRSETSKQVEIFKLRLSLAQEMSFFLHSISLSFSDFSVATKKGIRLQMFFSPSSPQIKPNEKLSICIIFVLPIFTLGFSVFICSQISLLNCNHDCCRSSAYLCRIIVVCIRRARVIKR